MGLAQIGEFSFILAEVARGHGLMDETGHNVIVACAIVSITVNPFLFHLINPLENFVHRSRFLWKLFNRKSQDRETNINAHAGELIDASPDPLAVIIGFGPVGQSVDALVRHEGLRTVIVDLNMDTIQSLIAQGRPAIYGDAFNIEVLHQALRLATHIIITLPESTNRSPMIAAAKLINPQVKVFVRAHYVSEAEELQQAGADGYCFEEAEAAAALARLVLADRGHTEDEIRRQAARVRREIKAAPGRGGHH
jgi:CPA2 family monovalent cation:H+ antiporter-2